MSSSVVIMLTLEVGSVGAGGGIVLGGSGKISFFWLSSVVFCFK